MSQTQLITQNDVALQNMEVQCRPTSAELEHVCVTEMGLAWGEVKTAPWVIANASPHQTQLTALHQASEAKFKPIVNKTTVNACVQKTGRLFLQKTSSL